MAKKNARKRPPAPRMQVAPTPPPERRGRRALIVGLVSAAVVAVLVGLAALTYAVTRPNDDPGTVPQASAIDPETGAIAVGSGAREVGVYFDVLCPVCGDFEARFGGELDDLVAEGEITLNLHPIAILDARSSDDYSSRGASAVYAVAVQSPEAAMEYQQLLFAEQPEEGGEGLSDGRLVELAEQVGAPEAAADIEAGTYIDFVRYQTPRTPPQPGTNRVSTPTIALGGEIVSNADVLPLTAPQFRELVTG